MITIYHNNRCRKSREGLEIIQQSGKAFKIVNYLEEVPSETDLKNIIKLLQIKPIELVRVNEAIWKENYKNKNLSDAEIITAMLETPKLIERPIVINGNKAVVGRPPETIKQII